MPTVLIFLATNSICTKSGHQSHPGIVILQVDFEGPFIFLRWEYKFRTSDLVGTISMLMTNPGLSCQNSCFKMPHCQNCCDADPDVWIDFLNDNKSLVFETKYCVQVSIEFKWQITLCKVCQLTQTVSCGTEV